MTAPARIRVLLYVPDLEMGGAERNVVKLAKHLDRSRFETAVVWSGLWGMAGEILQSMGVPLHRFRLDPSELEPAIKVYRDLRPDVYLSCAYHSLFADVQAAHQAGVRAIVARRGDTRHWDRRHQAADADFDRNRLTRHVIACSEAAAWVCHNVERMPWEKITVVHTGVEVPPHESLRGAPDTIRHELRLPDHVRLIGNTANYRALKGYENLLRAFRRVVDQFPGVYFVACGAEVESGHLKKLGALVRKLGLESKVSLLGQKADLSGVYGGLDLFVQASSAEGLSNSLVEAMSWGLPVIATAVGGTPEAVTDGLCGRLVPPSDEDALAAAMIEALGQPELAGRWGKAARERVEQRFTMAGMIASYEAAFERIFRETTGAC